MFFLLLAEQLRLKLNPFGSARSLSSSQLELNDSGASDERD